ncbi:MAG: hypothetical protein HKN22_07290 [Bacteroidia bacterium]|nr:hypothetical protein [Bacteroidia bacterium]
MNKALKFFLYFVLITIILDMFSAVVLNYFDSKNRYGMSGGNINYYIENPSPDILIMGSSRAHHYVIPDSLSDSAFNLSHNGMGIGYQACLIDVLKQEEALPNKYLFLEIEPEEFVVDEKPLLYDIQFINRYYRQNEYVRSQINRISKYEFLKYLFRSFPLNGKIPSLAKNTIKTMRGDFSTYDGYSPAWPSKDDSLRTVITAARRSKKDKTYEREQRLDRENSEGLKYLNHIVKICKEKNLELILFTTPYYAENEYFKHQDDLKQYCGEIGVTYFDFTTAVVHELTDPWLWVDNSHINHKGAQIFSGLLAKDFKMHLSQGEIQ